MKRFGICFFSVLLLTTAMLAQQPLNTAQLATVGSAGAITTSTLTATLAPGPVYCRGGFTSIWPTSFTFSSGQVGNTYWLYYDCSSDQVSVSPFPAPGTAATPSIASILVNTSTLTVTDLRSAQFFGTSLLLGNTAHLTGAAYTNATTTFSNVTGLALPIAASQNYHLICRITWQGSAGTTGPKYQFTGPASPTAVVASMWSNVTVSTYLTSVVTAFSTPLANSGTVTTATNFTDLLDVEVVNGVNAGTVQLQAAANGAGTLTIQPGSVCFSTE